MDGKNIQTFNDVSKYFKDEYTFAKYYGHNWNAFTDCMHDLDFWDEKHGFVLVIYNMKKCFKNDRNEKRIFLSCLESVAYYLEKECITTSGGRNHIKSFDVYLINEDISREI